MPINNFFLIYRTITILNLVLFETIFVVFSSSILAVEGIPSKPNVLFIVIEDTNWKSYGCYGNTVCKTPNIDKLASSGVVFEHAYCQGSACNASRTSFLSGLRPRTTRVWNNGTAIRNVQPEWVIGMPELFKQAGYTTIDIGKIYHHGADFAPKQMMAFDRIENGERPEGWQGPAPILKFPNVKPDPAKEAKSRIIRDLKDGEAKKANSDRYGDSGLDQENEGDWQRAKIAATILEEYANDKNTEKKPFFIVLGQSKPHAPFLSPTKFAKKYDPAQIPDPVATISSFKDFPYIKRATVSNNDIFRETPSTPETAKEAIAAYYGCVSFIDDNLSLPLNTLEKTGLDKNTIVILLGDHGVHLGDHNMWSKYSMLEGTHHAPLIIRVPNAKENGKICREIVEFVDILPTLIDLCDLRKPDKLEGVSFTPLLQKNVAISWKSAAFIVDQDNGQAVRTKKYSYMEFGDPKKNDGYKSALFDLEKDPNETVNRINDPQYTTIKQELAELLKQGWKQALPPDTK
ncbi:MAG: sulfatase [Planctomycetaceae bacterium]|nr:sulfatase [Planctomycetaceae bacterium]